MPSNLADAVVLSGKYALEEILGRGKMGIVWRARHVTLDEPLAVKTLPSDVTPESAARFQFEAQIAAKLARRSPQIARVQDHGEDMGMLYLVMDLLEGQSLDQRLCRGALDLVTTARMVRELAWGLEAAHAEGVLHRDLKPANVFLLRRPEAACSLKILDFGIARPLVRRPTSRVRTAKGFVLGTTPYMSPEQARARELDRRCDVWALCVVAFEALTGRTPFAGKTEKDTLLAICGGEGTSIAQLRPDLPREAHAFFARAFAASIADRYQSAREAAEALDAAARVTELRRNAVTLAPGA